MNLVVIACAERSIQISNCFAFIHAYGWFSPPTTRPNRLYLCCFVRRQNVNKRKSSVTFQTEIVFGVHLLRLAGNILAEMSTPYNYLNIEHKRTRIVG